jgi:hypothetical protein
MGHLQPTRLRNLEMGGDVSDPTATQLFQTSVRSHESDERFTPSWVFDGLGLVFDLDPAAPAEGGDCVPARTRFTRLDDGLSQRWHGLVWLNPPFSEATPWADRFREHANGIFLGPVANARWWIELLRGSDLVWHARDFPFDHPTHAGRRSSMPLAFVAYGEPSAAALTRLATTSGHDGVLLNRWVAA